MAIQLASLAAGLAGKATPIGMAAQAVGGIMNVIGAFGQKKEAKKQLAAQQQYAGQQRGRLEAGYGDLLAAAQGLPTYKGDISRFEDVTKTAQQQLQLAGGRVAGEDIAREQIAQQTANVLGAAARGGRSSQDILSSVLFAQGQGAQAARQQEADIMQMRQQRQMQAQQNLLSSLGATAAAAAQQRGMEFESQAAKAQQILGLQGQKMQAGLSLEQQLFEEEQAKRGALANARAAIFSGIGDIASTIGGGLMQSAQFDKMMGAMYPSKGGGSLSIGDLSNILGNTKQAVSQGVSLYQPTEGFGTLPILNFPKKQ